MDRICKHIFKDLIASWLYAFYLGLASGDVVTSIRGFPQDVHGYLVLAQDGSDVQQWVCIPTGLMTTFGLVRAMVFSCLIANPEHFAFGKIGCPVTSQFYYLFRYGLPERQYGGSPRYHLLLQSLPALKLSCNCCGYGNAILMFSSMPTYST